MRRIPLWTTLIPLAAGIGGYWLVWHRFSAQFATDMGQMLPAQTVHVGGFPYRLEAEFDSPNLRIGDASFAAAFNARHMILNRGPWQPDLTVMRSVDAVLTMAATKIDGAQLNIRAPSAQGSLRRAGGRIARLSLVFNDPSITIADIVRPLRAAAFEIHLRQPTTVAGSSAGPKFPARLEGIANGTQLRFAGSAALNMSMTFSVTGQTQFHNFAAWADGGTIEIANLKLTDASGEILSGSATIAPIPNGTLHISGSLMTVCPAAVRAAFAGVAAPTEQRLRTSVRLAFGGDTRAIAVGAPDTDVAGLTRRGQLPPCPVLRR
jgi:hypothetical protein